MLKRIFEFSAALLTLFVLSPLLFIISLFLFLTGEHRVFHFSKRVGRNKKIFNMVKFSTMSRNGSVTGVLEITQKDDPRILPFGRFLRISKIDEIPQLLNILKGEMGFIGPRPLLPRIFEFYTPLQQEFISSMKPGITGIGSVFFRDEAVLLQKSHPDPEKYYELEITPHKSALEKWYFENKSICVDIKIMFCTLVVIFDGNSKIPHRLFRNLPEIHSPVNNLPDY